jgi:hypothetical protein
MSPEEEFVVAELTEPVRASLDPAVSLVEELLTDLTRSDGDPSSQVKGKE